MTHIPCQPIYMQMLTQIFFVQVLTQIQLNTTFFKKNWSKYTQSSRSPKINAPFRYGRGLVAIAPFRAARSISALVHLFYVAAHLIASACICSTVYATNIF